MKTLFDWGQGLQRLPDRITAVVILHNGISVIEPTLRALREQSHAIDEIVVVDDCSTDGSPGYVKKTFPEVRLLSTPLNSGPGAARNLGASQSSNGTILFLDHDVTLEKTTLEQLMKAVRSEPEYAIFVPTVVYHDNPEVIQSAGGGVHYLGISILSQYSGLTRSTLSTAYEPVLAFGGGCYLQVNNRLRETVRYDENFFYTFEDTDFALTNARCGNSAVLVPSAVVRHRVGTTEGLSHVLGQEYPSRRMALLAKNHLLIVAKHYSPGMLALCIPALTLFGLALTAYGFMRTEDRWASLKGYARFGNHLADVLRFRTRMQRSCFRFDLRRHLSRKLRIKASTYEGTTSSVIFRLLDRFFSLYGKLVLRMP